MPDVVTTQPLRPRQRRFNSAVADATQEYLQAVPRVKAKEKIGEAENITCRRPPIQIPPSRTDDSSPGSSSPSTPLVARLPPSSLSLSPPPALAVGDQNRA